MSGLLQYLQRSSRQKTLQLTAVMRSPVEWREQAVYESQEGPERLVGSLAVKILVVALRCCISFIAGDAASCNHVRSHLVQI